ncbi:MAG: ABC transporter ATP-binding protein [Thermomicrobiales bacterium]|nr:ABC transporter ATP-binding protein [Thermomicrobiales bacterium]
MARVTLRELNKTFADVTAVRSLSLDIDDGEFVTLLGPSGCGKSTTLACIAGLEDPTGGDILFDDKVVNDLSPRNRDIAMVFQDYALYPHMTVYENMAFGLSLRKMPKAEADAAVRRVSEFLGLAKLLDRKPGQLSGGQRQRVALGRAIVRNPAVFLMDEPLSNLDAALRVSTRSEIKQLQQDLGTTTIFVTHDQEEAMVLSDRIAIMHGGVLQQFDAPKVIYNEPINLFVATFIGSPKMNIMTGAVQQTGNGRVILPAGDAIAVPVPDSLPTPASGTLTAGVRPEHVRLSRDGEGLAKGAITLVEPVGAVTYVDVSLGTSHLKTSTDPALDFQPGETVSVDFTPGRTLYFDPESGERVTA